MVDSPRPSQRGIEQWIRNRAMEALVALSEDDAGVRSLQAWQAHLEANGVTRRPVANKPLTQSPITDEDYGSVLVFRDPDNIQLETGSPAHYLYFLRRAQHEDQDLRAPPVPEVPASAV